MEDVLMEALIKISQYDCSLIAGGRSEIIASFVEQIAQGIGAFTRLLYLASRKSGQTIAMQAASGEFQKW